MAATTDIITKDEENGFRLHLLLGKCNEALLKTFHKTFSSSPHVLYNELKKIQVFLVQLKNKRVITLPQWNLLFPKNYKTDSKHFDVSLLFLLLRHGCNMAPPASWTLPLATSDYSPVACIMRIKNQRNELIHRALSVSDTEYYAIWTELSKSLLGLGFHNNNDIMKIQNCALDLKVRKKLKAVEADLKKEQSTSQQLRKDISKLKNNLRGVWWKVLLNVKNFIGREDDAKNLHDEIKYANGTFGAVITGMGGVGKTELAKYYCNTYGMIYYDGNVVWMEADDISTLESSFFKVANFLDIAIKDAYGNISDVATIVTKVYNFFAGRRSLFVFDNLLHQSNIVDYLPTSIPPNLIAPTILITTQYKNWNANFVRVELNVFSIGSTEHLIKANLATRDITQSDVKVLSQLTGNLPLALQQAVSYIKRHNISIAKYAILFKENFEKVFYRNEDDIFYKKTVLTTWTMALDKLRETNNHIAMDIMFIMAYMSGKNINKDILLGLKVQETELNEALDDLALYSLIYCDSIQDDVSITIHSLIQLVVKKTAPSDTPNILLDLLKKQIKVSQFNKCDFGNIWLDHMISVFQNCSMNKDLTTSFLILRIHLKQALLNRGKYTLCCTLFSNILDKISPYIDHLTSYAGYDLRSDIAKAMQYCGKFADAKVIYEEMAKEQEVICLGRSRTHFQLVNISPCNSIPRVSTKYSAGTKNCADEDWNFVDYIKDRGKVLAKHAPIILISTRRNLALCALHQGNYNESRNILEEVKNFIINFYGDLHPSLNDIDHLLALCLMRTGKYKEALRLFKEVEEHAAEVSSGVKRKTEQYDIMKQEGMLPDVITIRSHIAKCLFKLKKQRKSLDMFVEVESKRREILGDEHPVTLQDRCNTATCIAQKFNLTEGIQRLVEIQEKQREIFEGATHPQVLTTHYNIAKSYLKRGYVAEALKIYEPLYQKQCDIYDESHQKVRATQMDIEYCTAKKCFCCSLRIQFDLSSSIIEFN